MKAIRNDNDNDNDNDNELVQKGNENYIGKIPGNIRITELQKIVLLGIAHILRRTLSIK